MLFRSLLQLSKLAEKDPEFYKYLQENDKELLEFDPDAVPDVALSDDGDIEMNDEEKTPVSTKDHLKAWQKPLLQVMSTLCVKWCIHM